MPVLAQASLLLQAFHLVVVHHVGHVEVVAALLDRIKKTDKKSLANWRGFFYFAQFYFALHVKLQFHFRFK